MPKETIAVLEIDLSDSLVPPVNLWIERFAKNEDCWALKPIVEGRSLKISAICLPFFLAYVDPAESNELDIARLQTRGREKIRSLLSHSANPRLINCYRRVLSNLEAIQVGEFHTDPLQQKNHMA